MGERGAEERAHRREQERGGRGEDGEGWGGRSNRGFAVFGYLLTTVRNRIFFPNLQVFIIRREGGVYVK